MRQGPHSKRGRGRGGNNNRRPHTPNRNQAFDSNGPDVRIRGNASQVHDKYLALARDAATSGDRIMAESYYQHADHYFRVLSQIAEEQEAHRQRQANNQNNGQKNDANAQSGDQQSGNQSEANAPAASQHSANDGNAQSSDEPEVELRGMAKAAKDANDQETGSSENTAAKQVNLLEMSEGDGGDGSDADQDPAPRQQKRGRTPRAANASADGAEKATDSQRPRRRAPRASVAEPDASAAE